MLVCWDNVANVSVVGYMNSKSVGHIGQIDHDAIEIFMISTEFIHINICPQRYWITSNSFIVIIHTMDHFD